MWLRNLHWYLRDNGYREELRSEISELRGLIEDLRRTQRSLTWSYGHYLRLDPDDQILTRDLCVHGCTEEFETELVREAVRPGDTVLDVGANIGYYTLHFAKLVGPTGRVFAFEPDPRNFALLRRNVAQNGYTNVTLVQKAVAAQTGPLRLYRNSANRGDHRVYASDAGRESIAIDAIRLDDFFADYRGRVNFIKFDIQGAEAAAWHGMSQLLARQGALRMCTEFWPRGLHLCGHDPQAYLHSVLNAGFEIRVIDEQCRELMPLDIPKLLHRLPIEPDTDMLFTNLYCERKAA
jgi:FkbM family methyltransferase